MVGPRVVASYAPGRSDGVMMSRIAEFVRQLSHGLMHPRGTPAPVPPPHADDGQGGAANILCEARLQPRTPLSF